MLLLIISAVERKLLTGRFEGHQVTLVCLMKHFSFVDCCLISVCLVYRLYDLNRVFRELRGRSERVLEERGQVGVGAGRVKAAVGRYFRGRAEMVSVDIKKAFAA